MEDKHVFSGENDRIKAPITKENVKKRTKNNGRFFVIALVTFSLAFATLCIAFIILDNTGIVPKKLFQKVLLGVAVFIVFEVALLIASRRNKITALISTVVCVAVICASLFGIHAVNKFVESMDKVVEPSIAYAHVGIYIKKDSSIASVIAVSEDKAKTASQVSAVNLDGCSIGTMLLNVDTGYSSQAIRMYRKEYSVIVKAFDDFGSMIDALRNEEIDAIIYNESYMSVYLGDDTDFYDWAEKVDGIEIKTEHIVTTKKADVASEPFLVFVSGIDTHNEDNFNEHSRSDANIIAAVDPVNKRILLVNTPRDYYVPLWGKSYAMDKLTHAGVYGVGCSMQTLESLYGIELNYYVRVNIHSLINIVDALGGITVHSDYNFWASSWGSGHQFYVGDNDIDGEATLLFIRERNVFPDGDRQRGIHQQEVIKAIVKKACSPAIVAHFTDVLSVVTRSIQTNIGREEVSALIKMQLSDMASWTFETVSVDGYGSMEHSYAIGMSLDKVWVMIPDYNTVNEAKEALKEFMAQ